MSSTVMFTSSSLPSSATRQYALHQSSIHPGYYVASELYIAASLIAGLVMAFTLPNFLGRGSYMEDYEAQPHNAKIRGLAITAYTFGFFIRWVAACFAGKRNFFPPP